MRTETGELTIVRRNVARDCWVTNSSFFFSIGYIDFARLTEKIMGRENPALGSLRSD